MIVAFVLLLLFEYGGSETVRDKTDLKVKTPNYPGNYPSNSSTTWRFRHEHGFWSINIDRFHVQNSTNCEADYLEIQDASNRPRFCGSIRSGNLYNSQGPDILLTFKSDGTTQHMGFHLEVFHFFTEDDMNRILKEWEKKKSARAQVQVEENSTYSWVFYTLLGIVGVALLLLIILSVSLVVGVTRKRHRKSRNYQRNVILKNPILAPKSGGRRYSKSNSRDERGTVSVISANTRSPTRYV